VKSEDSGPEGGGGRPNPLVPFHSLKHPDVWALESFLWAQQTCFITPLIAP